MTCFCTLKKSVIVKQNTANSEVKEGFCTLKKSVKVWQNKKGITIPNKNQVGGYISNEMNALTLERRKNESIFNDTG